MLIVVNPNLENIAKLNPKLQDAVGLKLVKIKPVGKRKVYDISVADVEHYLLENGLITHNTGIYYSANTIFIITKRQVKEGDALAGWEFVINIEKSRFVKEKSKLPFTVTYADGIKKHSGLFDLAVEAKFIIKASAQTWSQVDPDTGEILPAKKTKTIENDIAFLERLVAHESFKGYVKDKYMMTSLSDSDEGFLDEDDLEDEDA